MTDSPLTPQYCYKHPNVETSLRCNRCERPICSRCAIHTETGYRCKECIRGQQKVFDTARWYDFTIAIILATGLSFLGGFLSTFLGFFAVLLGIGAGIGIAEIVRVAIRRRRNRLLFKLVAVGIFLGGLLPTLPRLIQSISILITDNSSPIVFGGFIFSLLWILAYSLIAAFTCYYRLSGLQLR